MNKKIVYITGCLGFIGAYVTRACLNQGWYVIGVDKETYAARLENLKQITLFYFYTIFITMAKTLKISEETHQKLKVYCVKNKFKLNEWVEQLIIKNIVKK